MWTRISETDVPEWDRLEEHTPSELLSRKLIKLPPDAPVAEAARRMVDERVHRVPVVEDDEVVGVASTLDIVEGVARASEREEVVEALGAGEAKYR